MALRKNRTTENTGGINQEAITASRHFALCLPFRRADTYRTQWGKIIRRNKINLQENKNHG
jgi:hypothetical protein